MIQLFQREILLRIKEPDLVNSVEALKTGTMTIIHSRTGSKQVKALFANPDKEYMHMQTDYEKAYLDYCRAENKLPVIEEEDDNSPKFSEENETVQEGFLATTAQTGDCYIKFGQCKLIAMFIHLQKFIQSHIILWRNQGENQNSNSESSISNGSSAWVCIPRCPSYSC